MTRTVHHLITHEPILVAPHRAARPHAFGNDASEDECPFCRGHEAMTPPEVLRVERDGEWIVRAFPNKYPAALRHEVIVESPDHDLAFAGFELAAGTYIEVIEPAGTARELRT